MSTPSNSIDGQGGEGKAEAILKRHVETYMAAHPELDYVGWENAKDERVFIVDAMEEYAAAAKAEADALRRENGELKAEKDKLDWQCPNCHSNKIEAKSGFSYCDNCKHVF